MEEKYRRRERGESGMEKRKGVRYVREVFRNTLGDFLCLTEYFKAKNIAFYMQLPIKDLEAPKSHSKTCFFLLQNPSKHIIFIRHSTNSRSETFNKRIFLRYRSVKIYFPHPLHFTTNLGRNERQRVPEVLRER